MQNLKYIINVSKRNKNYEKLVSNIQNYINEKEQAEMEKILNEFIDFDFDKYILLKNIEKYKSQQENVRNQSEYDYLQKCIITAEFILKNLL